MEVSDSTPHLPEVSLLHENASVHQVELSAWISILSSYITGIMRIHTVRPGSSRCLHSRQSVRSDFFVSWRRRRQTN